MELGYVNALRNARSDEITAAIGTSGLLHIRSGTHPATGGAETSQLAADDTSADAPADASRTATWPTPCTTAGAGMPAPDAGQCDDTTFVAAGTVSMSSVAITEGFAR